MMILAFGVGLGLAAGKWIAPRPAGELPRGESADFGPDNSPAAASSDAVGTGASGPGTKSGVPRFSELPPQKRESREGLRAIEPNSDGERDVVAHRRPKPGLAESVPLDASGILDSPPGDVLKPSESVSAAVEPARPLLQTEDAMVPSIVGPALPTGGGEAMRVAAVAAVAVASLGEVPIRAMPVEEYSAKATSGSGLEPKLDPRFLEVAGKRIWMSECSGSKEGLTSWNSGEDFVSLGIGHFLWFPEGKEFPFEESFPKYLEYHRMRSAGEKLPSIPEWLGKATDCPWATRSDFLKAEASSEMISLRVFLHDTFTTQVEFIYQRLLDSQTILFAVEDCQVAKRMDDRFKALNGTPEGKFAMMDYVNFKGDGTKPEEVFKGKGWGLRQVLEEMNENLTGFEAAEDFAEASEAVLRRRVQNHPADARWIEGWSRRTKEYAKSFFGEKEGP
jgi:hypothetical protein